MDGEVQNVQQNDTENEMQREVNVDTVFDFEEQTCRTDFVIIVEGTRLHVARNILSLASPVFDRMLRSGFNECKTGELEITDHKLDEVKSFLRCIYPNTLTPVTFETVLKVLPLVEKYQVNQLKGTCEKAIIDGIDADAPTDVLYTALNEAYLYDLRDARKKCVNIASKKSIKETNEMIRKYNLTHEVLNEILRHKIFNLEAENEKLTKANSELQKQAESLEENRISLNLEMERRHDYIANDLNETEELWLEPDHKWKETEVLIKMDSGNYCKCRHETNVWGMKFSIATDGERLFKNSAGNYFAVEIEKVDCKPLEMNVLARFIVLNRRSKDKNLFRKTRGRFAANNTKLNTNIKDTANITNVTNGFIKNNQIWLLVQLFVSEPTHTRK